MKILQLANLQINLLLFHAIAILSKGTSHQVIVYLLLLKKSK